MAWVLRHRGCLDSLTIPSLGMHPQKQLEFWAWARVVLAIVFLIGLALFYQDYTKASVEWRAGRVVDKDRRITDGSSSHNELFTHYYLRVTVGEGSGRVNVGGWEYTQWQVGQVCEVAFRHGRIMDYNYTDIRYPKLEAGRSQSAY